MKKLVLIIAVFVTAIITTTTVVAQTLISGYFVVPNSYLIADMETYMGNKLKTSFAQAGLYVSEGFFPIVTAISYDETEVIELQGIRNTFKTIATITVSVISATDNSLVYSFSSDVSGVGVGKDQSRINAIKSINIPKKKMSLTVEIIRQNYMQIIESFGEIKLNEAKRFKAQRNYIIATDEATLVPSASSFYPLAQSLIAECEVLYNKEVETKRITEELEKTRNHELKLKDILSKKEIEELRIKSVEKTEHERIKNRAAVEIAYYKMWQSSFLR